MPPAPPLSSGVRRAAALLGMAGILWPGIALAEPSAPPSGWLLRILGPGNQMALCAVLDSKPQEAERVTCATRAQDSIHIAAGGQANTLPVNGTSAQAAATPAEGLAALLRQPADVAAGAADTLLRTAGAAGRFASLGHLIEIRLPPPADPKGSDPKALLRTASDLATQLADPFSRLRTELATKDGAATLVHRQWAEAMDRRLQPIEQGIVRLNDKIRPDTPVKPPSPEDKLEPKGMELRFSWVGDTLKAITPRANEPGDRLVEVLAAAGLTVVCGLIGFAGGWSMRGRKARSRQDPSAAPAANAAGGQRAAALVQGFAHTPEPAAAPEPAALPALLPSPQSDLDFLKNMAARLHRGIRGKDPATPEENPIDCIIADLGEIESRRWQLAETVRTLTNKEPKQGSLSILMQELATAGEGVAEQLRIARKKLKNKDKAVNSATETLESVAATLSGLVSIIAPAQSEAASHDTIIEAGKLLADEFTLKRELRLLLAAMSLAWERLGANPLLESRSDIQDLLRPQAIRNGLHKLRRTIENANSREELWTECLSGGFMNDGSLHDLLRAEFLLSGYFRDKPEFQDIVATACAAAEGVRAILATLGVVVDEVSLGDPGTHQPEMAQAPDGPLLSVAEVREYQESHRAELDGKVVDVQTFGYTPLGGPRRASKVVLFYPAALDRAMPQPMGG